MSAKTLKMELELLVSWLLGKLIRVASFKGMFTSNFLFFFFFRMQKLSKGIWSSVRLEHTNCLSEATQTSFSSYCINSAQLSFQPPLKGRNFAWPGSVSFPLWTSLTGTTERSAACWVSPEAVLTFPVIPGGPAVCSECLCVVCRHGWH